MRKIKQILYLVFIFSLIIEWIAVPQNGRQLQESAYVEPGLASQAGDILSVIVTAKDAKAASRAVTSSGGQVTSELWLIDAVAARLPAGRLDTLASYPGVAEAAVIGVPHYLKGQGIYSLVTLKPGIEPGNKLVKELKKHVSNRIGRMAEPDIIRFADSLPRTPDGKIMRRMLADIAAGDTGNTGPATPANPAAAAGPVQGEIRYASRV